MARAGTGAVAGGGSRMAMPERVPVVPAATPAVGADAAHMAEALALAERGRYTAAPNPRVGCVIVRDGRIVGRGWHMRAGKPHAEIYALREAGAAARGATAFVTLEPCSHFGRTAPCTAALIEAGITRVVSAMEDPNPLVSGRGFAQLQAAGVAVTNGIGEAQARALNAGFMRRMTQGRPQVTVKLAASLDGRTALPSGESKWLTSPAAREDVHRLRAAAGAIMTGSGTVLADDPALTVRLPAARLQDPAGGQLEWRQPLRVVLDARARCAPGARVFTGPGPAWWVTGAAATPAGPPGVRQLALPTPAGGIELAALLQALGEAEINDVLVEAGPMLAGALLQAGLVDALVLYLAPHLLGDAGRGLFTLPGIKRMDQRVPLQIEEIRAVGPDWRVTARPLVEAG